MLVSCPFGRESKGQLVVQSSLYIKYSFLIASDLISTQHLDILQMWKWNQTRRHGGTGQSKKPHRSPSRSNWLNPRLNNSFLFLPHTMNPCTTSSLLEAVDRVHAFYTLWLPHYKVLNPIGIFLSPIRATTVIFDAIADYSTPRRSGLPLVWQRHVCSDYQTRPMQNAN